MREIDGAEAQGHYFDRISVPEPMRLSIPGFLAMTAGRAEDAGLARNVDIPVADVVQGGL